MDNCSLSRSVERITHAIFAACGTPRALAASLLLRHGEWDQLASLRLDPKTYSDSHLYYLDAVATSFLRKLDVLPTTIDRKAVAVAAFWKCEKDNYQTNLRLRDIRLHGSDVRITEFIRSVRKNVRVLLGSPPEFVQGRFGPGATFRDIGQQTTVADKMSSAPTLYSPSLGWLFQWSATKWCESNLARGIVPEVVRGNRFTTVPKDATKDRGIAVEASISSFYQLGIGRFIRRRLKRFNLDLEHGQDIHRRVACEASVTGALATLDLSNASDTVSMELVKILLPRRWFDLLSSLRAPRTFIEGKWVVLEKFSSMGNGFTFELETLLFAAISLAASKRDCSALGDEVFAYGDDLIVPTDSALDVMGALTFFGLAVNEEKSFWQGPFRESCGGDFFKGEDVRPHFLKGDLCEPQDYIKLANGIRRISNAASQLRLGTDRFIRPWFCTLDELPVDIRACRGPAELGDVVIHDDQTRWVTRWRHGIRYLKCYRPISRKRVGWEHFWPDVQLACALYGTGSGTPWRTGLARQPDAQGLTPRDAVTGHKKGWVSYS